MTSIAKQADKPTNWDRRWAAYQEVLKKHPAYKDSWSQFYEGCEYEAALSSAGVGQLHRAERQIDDTEQELIAAKAGVGQLVEALQAIVQSAHNGNEPGQTWIMIAGGLIDDAEAALVTSLSKEMEETVTQSAERSKPEMTEQRKAMSQEPKTTERCPNCDSPRKEHRKCMVMMDRPHDAETLLSHPHLCIGCNHPWHYTAESRSPMEQRIEKLEEALRKYGHHLFGCPVTMTGAPDCYCGFEEAVRGDRNGG